MSLLPFLGPLGSVIGSVAGGLLNSNSQSNANQANIDLMNRQNEYNSPVNQMKRLKAAGLNPNLVYGSGSVANTSAPAPTVQPARLGEAANSIVPAIAQFVGIMKTQADTAKTQADADLARANTSNVVAGLGSTRAASEYDTDTVGMREAKLSNETNLLAQQGDINQLAINYGRDANPILLKQLATNLLVAKFGMDKTKADTVLTNRNIDWQTMNNNIAKMGGDPNAHSDTGQVVRFLMTWLSRLTGAH